ncbi:hypothetical protein HMPREF0492_1843 [Lactobacillus acidophilus ATCC 4796]|nr:hypothetical protein HMPREF0492_1843 [Lactobacillus acidophilus ATCC 4796]
MTQLSRFLYGGDYNPDQWPEETWSKDIHVFKKADINSATINIFLGHCLNQEKENIISQN